MLSVLRHPVYARLFSAQALSLVGTGLTTVALGLLAYDLAGADAGVVLGTALAIKMVAYVGIAPIAGALAGLLPRRGFLVGLDLCRAAMVLLLPFVSEVRQIYLLVFLFQACSAAFTPTFQATIPDVLARETTIALIDRHLRDHRPRLVPPGSPFLFPRRDGQAPMEPSYLSKRISKTIRRELGLEMNPQSQSRRRAPGALDARGRCRRISVSRGSGG